MGDPIALRLRATALGGITKTITIVAASVLILALLRRVVRRLRRSSAGAPPTEVPLGAAG